MHPSPLPFRPVLAGVRILVVDSDPDAAELLAAVFAAHGASPATASNEADALGAIETLAPEVLVTEPAPTGASSAFIRAARARCPDVFAIALTSYIGEQDRQQALAEGFDLRVPKPFEVDNVIPLLVERLHACRVSASTGVRERPTFSRTDPAERAKVMSGARAVAGNASATVIQISDFLERARTRNASLRTRATASQASEVLQDALEELGTNEEELRVADEQLREGSDAIGRIMTEHAAELLRYQRHLDRLPDGFAATDARGNVQQANKPLAALLNAEARFLVGKLSLTRFGGRFRYAAADPAANINSNSIGLL